ncbi:MAG: site-2 protease family protein [Anaerotardibacter sp.]
MDALISIMCCLIILSVLVFIHEGGHFLVARAFGVRVTEFMLGLPGPNIGFQWKGTRFGVTAIPLGGYAMVCGMTPKRDIPYLKEILGYAYTHGTVSLEEIERAFEISEDQALEALEELCEWGSLKRPLKTDTCNIYRTPETNTAPMGTSRVVEDLDAFYDAEDKMQYHSLPFIKRVAILLAGPAMNLLYAMVVFVIIYSVLGIDLQNTQTGEVFHYTLTPFESIIAGFNYIGAVFVAILGLFNPATVADTVSNSTSIIGIAVLSKTAFEQGLVTALSFSAIISVSLGLMNALPIPPLDGGKFVIEVVQKITGRNVSIKVQNAVSTMGMALFLLLFVVMVNQDVQRFIFGNWG